MTDEQKKYCLGPNQEKAVRALEEADPATQIRQYTSNGEGGYCALGVMSKAIGHEPRVKVGCVSVPAAGDLGLYSLHGNDKSGRDQHIFVLNDGNSNFALREHTFKEIAAELRKDPKRWFKAPM